MSPPMPALFIGHGSPMNAIEDTPWNREWRALAGQLPRPEAILSVSAHWCLPGTWVTGNEWPETIHDFGGFPRALFELQYPAPGSPGLARRVIALLGAEHAGNRMDWGLDHGTWTVLYHLMPRADVPVVQLSLDVRMSPADHLGIGKRLAPLRDEGVLILGSGNITHNLRDAFGRMHSGDRATPMWAARFDQDVTSAIADHDLDRLVHLAGTEDGRMAHPTIDHFLPLLYTMGAATKGEPVRFPIEGFDLGSLSMRAVIVG